MKPLFKIVVALSVLLAINALPEEPKDVKPLSQAEELIEEVEPSDSKARVERCENCGTLNFNVRSPTDVLASIKALPGATVHTQSSYEGCSTESGCAGLKIKDGKVIERFGNLDSLKAASAADTNNEFVFHAPGFNRDVFNGAIPVNGPFWWMNKDSPFKAGANFGKYSQSSSSYSSSGTGGSGAGFTAPLDLSLNPYLNGQYSINANKPSTFESSSSYEFSQSSNNNNVDLSKNPFLNGGFKFQGGQGFAQNGASQSFGAGINAASGNKFSTGYVGSSPSPFVSTGNVNVIQNEQKTNDFNFDQQQQTQQSIDEAFQGSSSFGVGSSGGDLQQTCAGVGYICAPKAQCNNGVVNSNGAGLLQASTKKQYCNLRTEICCRIETSAIGSTFNQGSGLFTSGGNVNSFGVSGSSGSSGQGLFGQSGQSTFGSASNGQGFGQSGLGSAGGQNLFGQSGSGTLGQSGSGYGSNSLSTASYESKGTYGQSAFGSTNANKGVTFGSGGSTGSLGFGSTVAPTTAFTSQSNFVETDSFTAGSDNAGVYRPGASGTGLKPGVPYLPPVDIVNSGSNIVSTAYPRPTFVTTPRPFVTARPTYLPPSTSAPGYLPPIGEQSINTETVVTPGPNYVDGSLILDENRLPRPRPRPTPAPRLPTPGPSLADIPAGCAAALKCTPIEYCTADGVISNTTVSLTRAQDAYRVPLTDCKDLSTGLIGKCCRDPYYTDPWPVNQIGQWVPGVFGGNDGRYVPDSGSSANNPRPQVTVRPPVTGGIILPNFRPGTSTASPFGQGQFIKGGQGQFTKGGQGQYSKGGQGQYSKGGQGQTSVFGQGLGGFVTKGQGQIVSQGEGQIVTQGQGELVSQGQGQIVSQEKYGQGQLTSQGQGVAVSQGFGTGLVQGQGEYLTGGQGLIVSQGQGAAVSQGFGQGVLQGGGALVSKGQGAVVNQGFGQGVTQGQGELVSQGFGQGILQGGGALVSKGQGAVVTQGFGQGVKQGQGEIVSQGFGQGVLQGQGTFGIQGQGEGVSQGFGQGIRQGGGAFVSKGQGAVVTQGFGEGVKQGQGEIVSQGFGTGVVQGQGEYVTGGQGQIVSQGQGEAVSQGFGQGILQGGGALVSKGQGAFVTQGFGQGVKQGQGEIVSQGFGQGFKQGQGEIVSQGFGQGVLQGQGAFGVQGQGEGVSQGFGQGIRQGGGAVVTQGFGTGVQQGEGALVSTGQGALVSQGFGQGVRQGQGAYVSQGQGAIVSQGFSQGIRQGQGFAVENEYAESVQRVFLQPYTVGGQCGLLKGQKPLGNPNDLEVDFAEIPWQAMILLKTNKSLLCGGVITRPDVVITSAACVDGLDAKNVLIKGGEWKLGIDEEPLPFQIVQVKTILRHPLYKSGTFHYDAAILVLSENLRFADNIYPICLPRAEETLDAFYNGAGNCIVTGWGKQVLQSHLLGSIMHSLNVSLINPGECQSKMSREYPHLLEYYDQDSCACGQPTNPANNICKVDIGSALACTTGDGHYVMRGLYSWDTGCQLGNQIGVFYRFDLEWYEWAIGLIESVRFTQYTKGSIFTGAKGTIKVGSGGSVGSFGIGSLGSGGSGQYSQFGNKGVFDGAKGTIKVGSTGSDILGGAGIFGNAIKGQFGFGQGQAQFGEYSGKFTSTSGGSKGLDSGFDINTQIKTPITNTFGYSEKIIKTEPKYVTYTTKPQYVTYTTKPEIVTYTTKPEIVTYTTKPEIVTYTTKPEIVTYTTKPEIVTFTTKPEYFTYTTKPKVITYTTKPKIVTYTTKPQFITYETSGSGTNLQYAIPSVSFKKSFSDVLNHEHNAKCQCLDGKK